MESGRFMNGIFRHVFLREQGFEQFLLRLFLASRSTFHLIRWLHHFELNIPSTVIWLYSHSHVHCAQEKETQQPSICELGLPDLATHLRWVKREAVCTNMLSRLFPPSVLTCFHQRRFGIVTLIKVISKHARFQPFTWCYLDLMADLSRKISLVFQGNASTGWRGRK